jgi:hypothetical protein
VGEALSDICSPYLDARDPHDQIGVLRGNFWLHLLIVRQNHHHLAVGLILSWLHVFLLSWTSDLLGFLREEFHKYHARESEYCAISWWNIHSDFI